MIASDKSPSRKSPESEPELCLHCGAVVPPLAVGEESPCGHYLQTDRPHPHLTQDGFGLLASRKRTADRPMWCDGFDLDLPHLVPDAREIVGDLGDVMLWTTGHTSGGVLNHPDVWNGYGGMLAFFGFRGLARPPGFVGSGEFVHCTAWEALRDAWPHGYTLHVERLPIWNTLEVRPELETIAWDARGWRAQPAEADDARAVVRRSLRFAVTRLRVMVGRHGAAVGRFGDAA